MLDFINFKFVDILDILIVAAIIFLLFKWIKGSTAVNTLIAVIFFLLIQSIASALGMKMLSGILGTVFDVGVIGLIIIFQPEIRRFLNSLGRTAGTTIEKGRFLSKLFKETNLNEISTETVTQIAEACDEMSEQKTGALIIICKKTNLEDIIATGDSIDAKVSKRLIMNIFYKNSPLHDGAMIISGNRITAARCTLPITDRAIPAHFGMRHKAAVGISEVSDADVVVVSEQTGRISFVRGGVLQKVDSINTLKLLLSEKKQ